MLALQAWCNAPHSSVNQVRVEAFAKLGGNRLGRIWLDEQVSKTNLVATIKDLQHQASILLRHPERTSNYMKLMLNNTNLPSLTYRDYMTEEVTNEVLRCLQGVTHGSKLEMSWDEDDAEALRVLRDTYELKSLGRFATLFLDRPCRAELAVLAYIRLVHVTISSAKPVITDGHDLAFLGACKSLTRLQLERLRITSWEFSQNLSGLTELRLFSCKIEAPIRLNKLDKLLLAATTILPSKLQGCNKLSKLTLVGYTKQEVNDICSVLEHVELVVM